MELDSITHFSQQDISEAQGSYRKNLINSLHGFKSACLVGTRNKAGETNLAIFTQVFHLGATPPLVGLIVRPHEVPRHTLENILENKQFTLNHVREEFYVEAHHTSARWNASEFEKTGLSPTYGKALEVPYVKESLIQIGLAYREHQTLQVNNTVFVVGEIVELRVPNGVLGEDGFLDLEAAGTVTVSGLDSYHTTQKLGRLSYAKPTHRPTRLA